MPTFTITGPGYATPNPGSLLNQYSGRVTPASVLQVVSKSGDLIDTGSAAQLISRAAADEKQADSFNKYNADNLRAASIQLPTGDIDFKTNGLFEQYLNRSATPIIADSVLTGDFQKTLRRQAAPAELVVMQNTINAGGSLGTVQWNLAHTVEAADDIRTMFISTFGRPISETSIPEYQRALSATSLSALRSGLSHTAEATARIEDVFGQTLNRPLDASQVPD